MTGPDGMKFSEKGLPVCHNCEYECDGDVRKKWRCNGKDCACVYCVSCLHKYYEWLNLTVDDWCPKCLNRCRCRKCRTLRIKQREKLLEGAGPDLTAAIESALDRTKPLNIAEEITKGIAKEGGSKMPHTADFIVKERLHYQFIKKTPAQRDQVLRVYGDLLIREIAGLLRQADASQASMDENDSLGDGVRKLSESKNQVPEKYSEAMRDLSGEKLRGFVYEIQNYLRDARALLTQQKAALLVKVKQAAQQENDAKSRFDVIVRDEKEHAERVHVLEAEAEVLRKKVQEVHSEMHQWEEREKEIATELGPLEATLTELDGERRPLKAELQSAQDELDAGEVALREAEQQYLALVQEYDEIFTLIVEAEDPGPHMARQEKIETLMTEADAKKKEVEGVVARARERVGELQGRLAALPVPSGLEGLEEKHGVLQSELRTVANHLRAARSQLQGAEERLKALEEKDLPEARSVLSTTGTVAEEKAEAHRQTLSLQADQMRWLGALARLNEAHITMQADMLDYLQSQWAGFDLLDRESDANTQRNTPALQTAKLLRDASAVRYAKENLPMEAASNRLIHDGDWVKVVCRQCKSSVHGLCVSGHRFGNVLHQVPCRCAFPQSHWNIYSDKEVTETFGPWEGQNTLPEFRELCNDLDESSALYQKALTCREEVMKAKILLQQLELDVKAKWLQWVQALTEKINSSEDN
eukprot:comp16653_c0_seq1/m.14856 comp16653_c0_seq1/g.14856  ORF comp16653_c0_seq1/g.14856 comp16653_c0_seq1/m.14856 type:complete len:702 (-) comp16653_c0_seq1:473-2578(-)